MGWKRQEEIANKAQRRTEKEIAMKRDHAKEAPSKYRDRQAARRRWAPMAARPFPPWWAYVRDFVPGGANPFMPSFGEHRHD